jgi:ribosomal protein S18 acetylase RimI-like enzyme
MEWLEKHGLTEPHDLEILDDPDSTVLAGGGCIYLAFDGGKVVGTAGLVKETPTSFELVKMAVDPDYRGRGISKILIERCIEEASNAGAAEIFLYSSSKLQVAIRLYEQYGFRHVDLVDSPFITADIKMALSLVSH